MPKGVEGRVAAEIAARWGVDSGAVRLEWGALPTAARVGDGTAFRLVGNGEEGTFVTVLEPTAGSPAAVKVRAGVMDTAVVATRAIARGVELAPEDLRREERVRWGRPAPSSARPAAGWVTRRPIAAGEVLTPITASAPQVVKAGDAVRLEWRRSGVVIALDGVALNAAGLGDAVRVRLANRAGQRSGRAVAVGVVTLDS